MAASVGPRFDAIVLAGGEGRRFGGDKALVEFDGESLLARAVNAVAGARHIVVVGEQRGGVTGVEWTQESPPGGGPVAALAAGLAAFGPDAEPLVAVVASDLPFVDAAAIESLIAAAGGRDGAVAVDEGDNLNPLLAVYRTPRLQGVLSANASLTGAALLRVLSVLELAEVSLRAASDVDTEEELDRAREGY
ncbi:MAG: NTP transferase domain-containing protein [Actinobacteria bacterium]|nr:NTP transferase domain-containing protein [Actinomycetota bacterium]